MEKLPEEFKKKWLEALRSGKYRQGMGQLYNESEDSFCCLGVACHVMGISTGKCEFIPIDADEIPAILRGHEGIPWELSELNDGLRVAGKQTRTPKTFSEIADWIERNL